MAHTFKSFTAVDDSLQDSGASGLGNGISVKYTPFITAGGRSVTSLQIEVCIKSPEIMSLLKTIQVNGKTQNINVERSPIAYTFSTCSLKKTVIFALSPSSSFISQKQHHYQHQQSILLKHTQTTLYSFPHTFSSKSYKFVIHLDTDTDLPCDIETWFDCCPEYSHQCVDDIDAKQGKAASLTSDLPDKEMGADYKNLVFRLGISTVPSLNPILERYSSIFSINPPHPLVRPRSICHLDPSPGT